MSKINQVLLDWIPGDIHGLAWFAKKGVEQRLAYSYFESGILKKIGPGVFARYGDELDWIGVVRFLQDELELPLHVAGRTALELQGHGHYVMKGKKTIYLTSYESRSLPSWVKMVMAPLQFVISRSKLLPEEEFLIAYSERNFKIYTASRELAILEFIDNLDLSNSLETVENYMNSLRTLRPKVMQEVLEKCSSIKVKRTFLYLAEKLALPFVKELKFKNISLGQGKRVIVKNGELNKKYQITVDRNYDENPF